MRTMLESLPTEILLRVFRGLTAEDILNIIKIPEFGLTKQRHDLIFNIVTGSKESEVNDCAILTDLEDGLINRLYLTDMGRDTVIGNPGAYGITIFCMSCKELTKHRRKIMKHINRSNCYLWLTETHSDDIYFSFKYCRTFTEKLGFTLAEFLGARVNVFIYNMNSAVPIQSKTVFDPALLSTRNVKQVNYRLQPDSPISSDDDDDDDDILEPSMSEYDSDGEEVAGPIIPTFIPTDQDTASKFSFDNRLPSNLKVSVADTNVLSALSGILKQSSLVELTISFEDQWGSRVDMRPPTSFETVIDGCLGLSSTIRHLSLSFVKTFENVDLPNLETLYVNFIKENAVFANVSIPKVSKIDIELYNESLEMKNIYAGGSDHVIKKLRFLDTAKQPLDYKPWRISGCDWIYQNSQELEIICADLFSSNSCEDKCFRKLETAMISFDQHPIDLSLEQYIFPMLKDLIIKIEKCPQVRLRQFQAPKLEDLQVIVDDPGLVEEGIADNHPKLSSFQVKKLRYPRYLPTEYDFE